MAETAFCYYCARHHPKDEMRRIETRAGKRWRCAKSILASQRSVAERDAYGRRVTEVNSATHRARSLYVASARELRER